MRDRALPAFLAFSALTFVAAIAAPHAQAPDRASVLAAQIDRIFKERAFDAPRFGPARWLPDGAGYATVERRSGGSEIDTYDAVTGAKTVLVRRPGSCRRARQRSLDIDDYEWSADGRRLLIFTNTRKVWRQNTRGDYWVLDVGRGALTQVGGGAAPSTLMFAKFSPDGARVAYVRDEQHLRRAARDGRITQLTTTAPIRSGSTRRRHHQRHVRLGVRRGAQPPRRLPLEPGRRAHRLLAVRHDRRRHLFADQRHVRHVSDRHNEFRIRKPAPATPPSALAWSAPAAARLAGSRRPEDPRNSYLATPRVDRRQHGRDSAVESAAEPERLLAWPTPRQATSRAGRSAMSRGHGWTCRTTWCGSTAAGRFSGRSERDGWRHVYRVAKDGGDADADHLVRRRRDRRRRRGDRSCISSRRRRTRRSATCIALRSTVRGRRGG